MWQGAVKASCDTDQQNNTGMAGVRRSHRLKVFEQDASSNHLEKVKLCVSHTDSKGYVGRIYDTPQVLTMDECFLTQRPYLTCWVG